VTSENEIQKAAEKVAAYNDVLEARVAALEAEKRDLERDIDQLVRHFTSAAALAKAEGGEPVPCHYCQAKGREWSPECEENKTAGVS
jgi:hypothetical protein